MNEWINSLSRRILNLLLTLPWSSICRFELVNVTNEYVHSSAIWSKWTVYYRFIRIISLPAVNDDRNHILPKRMHNLLSHVGNIQTYKLTQLKTLTSSNFAGTGKKCKTKPYSFNQCVISWVKTLGSNSVVMEIEKGRSLVSCINEPCIPRVLLEIIAAQWGYSQVIPFIGSYTG